MPYYSLHSMLPCGTSSVDWYASRKLLAYQSTLFHQNKQKCSTTSPLSSARAVHIPRQTLARSIAASIPMNTTIQMHHVERAWCSRKLAGSSARHPNLLFCKMMVIIVSRCTKEPLLQIVLSRNFRHYSTPENFVAWYLFQITAFTLSTGLLFDPHLAP